MNLNLNTKKNAFVRAFTLTISHFEARLSKKSGKIHPEHRETFITQISHTNLLLSDLGLKTGFLFKPLTILAFLFFKSFSPHKALRVHS